MSAAARLRVSSNCPNCGAAIDFGEGTNALVCDHCRSRLLVTGHGRVLSYFVSPKVDGAAALSAARFAEPPEAGPTRAAEPRLFFLPYYRLTGTDVRWQRPERRPTPPPDYTEANAGSDSLVISLIARAAERDQLEEIECRDRAIERNFLALDVSGVGLYSLGIRPNALRLELYHRDSLEALGRVIGVEMAEAAAIDIGRMTGDAPNVAFRAVIGAVLSVVYFPFWLVEVRHPQKRALTIVDAVSQSVVTRGAPLDLIGRLERSVAAEPCVIGFRPLVCPNCGWDLPVEPDHVIFYCGSCHQAWRVRGDELLPTPHGFVALPAPSSRPLAEHLPFWSLRVTIDERAPQSFLAPAFRYRQARALVDAVRRWPTHPLGAESTPTPAPRSARGASFDEADAAALVLLAEAGEEPQSFTQAERYRDATATVGGAELVWLPFVSDVYSLRDPFSNAAIAAKLLG